MCGITGFTHSDRSPNPTLIRESTRSITHRGPDQEGVFESRSVSLGAVRLKIIDLHGGEQPMRSDDGDTVIVFNGEVYNHGELRQELEGLGVTFRSRCDTEVVLKAYLRWGQQSFTRLRGMFAAGLWTESEQKLVLVRDRMGIKPLYIYQRGGDLYFGSELKCLFAHPEIERRLDLAGLNRYLSLNYIPGPHTMVEGIRKLPPGHWLEWRRGRIISEPYWQLKFNPQPASLENAKEELHSLLQAAVKEHLVSDVPLGIWSSGGLDSSTVLHYAAAATPATLKTFSVSFLGRKFDESAYFRQIAERYGTDHHEFDLNPDVEIQDAIQQMPFYSDEPSSDAGALPVWFLSRMCRREVTVALSGEGADELFGGYNTYLGDGYARLLRVVPAALRRAGLRLMHRWPASDDKISLEFKIKRMLAGSLLSPGEAHFFWNGTSSEAERRQLMTAAAFLETGMPDAGTNGAGYLNRFLLLDQQNYLPDDILYKCDRMSMAHSLEVRPPFLDHRIVEFATRLPEGLKINGSSLKYILRELMKDKLPPSILTRKKEGFDIPAHDWCRGVLKPLLLE
ncbi:MAG TPA: asparagine synthase (glutamine-hydrolyzing), partial [Bryobacteraceae bacterium]|nr:asparagine synthase (glutamine-hydrolyzing) [Bryobacteraceae bacterium]